MYNFTHDIPTKILFGKGQIEKLTKELSVFGKRVLLAYGGGSIKKTGLYDDVMRRLEKDGFTVTECSGIEPNPRIATVEKGVRLCRENKIDAVLAVGGGSTIDCAKAICAGVYFDGDLWDMVMHPEKIRKALPLVDVLSNIQSRNATEDRVAFHLSFGFHLRPDLYFHRSGRADGRRGGRYYEPYNGSVFFLLRRFRRQRRPLRNNH